MKDAKNYPLAFLEVHTIFGVGKGVSAFGARKGLGWRRTSVARFW